MGVAGLIDQPTGRTAMDATPKERAYERVMENVLKAAEAAGVRQGDLAEKVGVAPLRFSKWKFGESVPSIGQIVRLARALGVTTDRLLDGVGELPTPPDGPTPERRIMDAVAMAITHGYLPGDPRFAITQMMIEILMAPADRYNEVFAAANRAADAAREANDEDADEGGGDEERAGED
jgi:transcriptional regulator with XRE-family HTH domain